MSDFLIKEGRLIKYNGFSGNVIIPDGVTEIGTGSFWGCTSLASVTIPDSVTKIGERAFSGCTSLASITIPESVVEIGDWAFDGCKSITSITIPNSLTEIGHRAFSDCTSLVFATVSNGVTEIGTATFFNCTSLASVSIPDSVTIIGEWAFSGCTNLASITIPGSVKIIGAFAFQNCTNLVSVTIPNSLTEIGRGAFCDCTNLASITIPGSVKIIGAFAFQNCTNLVSVTIPNGVTEIGTATFFNCTSLASVSIPDSVTKIGENSFFKCTSLASITIPENVTEIGDRAFDGFTSLSTITIPDSVTKIGWEALPSHTGCTIICPENSVTHKYCVEHSVSFLFDYQYQAFHGAIPHRIEMLKSPFLADEEKPYIFISYSHKDRDTILPILKDLYESGWRIWYDEGLTVGDSYDQVLENHVKNCSVFLLYITENSLLSHYIDEYEIPWAKKYNKPIIRCTLDEGTMYEIPNAEIVDTVFPDAIELALKNVKGLARGEKRKAKGITVAVDPFARNDFANGERFAYCLYAKESEAEAKTILHSIENAGAVIYNSMEEGDDEVKLKESACLIVFVDKAFLSGKLKQLLIDTYRYEKEIAVCLLEDVIFPDELKPLQEKQWLNYAYKVPEDMNRKLIRYLEKMGCRDITAIPEFDYEKTEKGIIIKRYKGLDPNPILEREYGGIPVVEIASYAFENNMALTEFTIPDGVEYIGECAFYGCIGLASISIPDSVSEIGYSAFLGCKSLADKQGFVIVNNVLYSYHSDHREITIPDGVTEIGSGSFWDCTSLASVTIPDSVTKIGRQAFSGCTSLASVSIPDSVTDIGDNIFWGCKSLADKSGFVIVNNVLYSYFGDNLTINIPDTVTKIEDRVFFYYTRVPYIFDDGTTRGTYIIIPDSVTKIGESAFSDLENFGVICSPNSYAFDYCIEHGIPRIKHKANS